MSKTKVTVLVETVLDEEDDTREYEELIHRLLRLPRTSALSVSQEKSDAAPEDGDVIGDIERGVNPSGWLFRDFEALWELLSPGARRVLAELAKKPHGYPDGELVKALKIDIQTIGGYLASLGRRKSRFAKQEPVYKKDASTGWKFVLAPEVAGYILLLWARGLEGDATG